MKKICLFFILIALGEVQYLYAQDSLLAKEGLFCVTSNYGRKDSVFVNLVWFRDSVAIHEGKMFIHADFDSFQLEGYELYKYSFNNLRNSICQDYHSFTDTASVICSYQLKPGDATGWYTYTSRDNSPIENFQVISDTIIDGNLYKRVKYTSKIESSNYLSEEYYYLSNKMLKSNLFIVHRGIEAMLPGYTICRVVLNLVRPDTILQTTDFKILRNWLTVEERKIFEKWGANALETKLPLSSLSEVNSMPSIPIKYKDVFIKWYSTFDLKGKANP